MAFLGASFGLSETDAVLISICMGFVAMAASILASGTGSRRSAPQAGSLQMNRCPSSPPIISGTVLPEHARLAWPKQGVPRHIGRPSKTSGGATVAGSFSRAS